MRNTLKFMTAAMTGVLIATLSPTAGLAVTEKNRSTDKDAHMQGISGASKDAGASVEDGIAYIWGGNVAIDRPRGEAILADLARKGNTRAKRVLGNEYLGGWALKQNKPEGMRLLKEAGAQGDTEAYVLLGKSYMEPPISQKALNQALVYFENAAALGDGEGLAVMGEYLMWSRVGGARAEKMLNRAGQLGYGPAWVALAKGASYGYLGSGRTGRTKYEKYAKKAKAVGENDIALVAADRKMWGINQRANGPETLKNLNQEAQSGNAAAAKYLIELQFNGNKYNIRRDIAGAKKSFEKYKDLLSYTDRDVLDWSIRAAQARSMQDYKTFAQTYYASKAAQSLDVGVSIFKTNENLGVYLAQIKLSEDDLYNGQLNGLATEKTLGAIRMACPTIPMVNECGRKLLTPTIIGALIAY